MNEFNECMTKAAQTADMLRSDINQALGALNALPVHPQGRDVLHRCAQMLLTDILADARILVSRLAQIQP